MSTSAILAVRTEAGVVGRYLHSDGYPEHVLPHLTAIIERDGGAKVAETILSAARGGWSFLSSDHGAYSSNPDLKVGVEGYGTMYVDIDPEEPIRWEQAVPQASFEYGYIVDPETGHLDAFELHGAQERRITIDEYLAVDQGN